MVAEYARTAALAQRASEELAASAVVGSMPSPWLAVHGSAVRSMATLLTRRMGPEPTCACSCDEAANNQRQRSARERNGFNSLTWNPME